MPPIEVDRLKQLVTEYRELERRLAELKSLEAQLSRTRVAIGEHIRYGEQMLLLVGNEHLLIKNPARLTEKDVRQLEIEALPLVT